jgi:quercetin dioxygenase-like cupin family protein
MKRKHFKEAKAIENPPLIFRKTLAYNEEAMLCSFELKKGGKIPLHSHRATQIGYVISGKVRFISGQSDPFECGAGDSYVFDSYAEHGAIALEDTMYIEVFTPSRDEYKDF